MSKWGCYVHSSLQYILFRLPTSSIRDYTKSSFPMLVVFKCHVPFVTLVSSSTSGCKMSGLVINHFNTPLSSVYFTQSQCHAAVSWVKLSWSDPYWRPFYPSPCPAWSQMELKVWVDGVVRVVCGLSEETSCQDVVIALAQAIGKC